MIFCNGVLHHTKDPKEGFNILTSYLKKGGFISIGLYNKYGRTANYIIKLLNKLVGKKIFVFDKVVNKFNQMHDQNIDKINSWINDQYFHIQESNHTFSEVIKWFNEKNIKITGSLPNINFPIEKEIYNLEKNYYTKTSSINLILKQINMIFQSYGAEGGLFTIVGKKL